MTGVMAAMFETLKWNVKMEYCYMLSFTKLRAQTTSFLGFIVESTLLLCVKNSTDILEYLQVPSLFCEMKPCFHSSCYNSKFGKTIWEDPE